MLFRQNCLVLSYYVTFFNSYVTLAADLHFVIDFVFDLEYFNKNIFFTSFVDFDKTSLIIIRITSLITRNIDGR